MIWPALWIFATIRIISNPFLLGQGASSSFRCTPEPAVALSGPPTRDTVAETVGECRHCRVSARQSWVTRLGSEKWCLGGGAGHGKSAVRVRSVDVPVSGGPGPGRDS